MEDLQIWGLGLTIAGILFLYLEFIKQVRIQ